jgi:hypothetical protein
MGKSVGRRGERASSSDRDAAASCLQAPAQLDVIMAFRIHEDVSAQAKYTVGWGVEPAMQSLPPSRVGTATVAGSAPRTAAGGVRTSYVVVALVEGRSSREVGIAMCDLSSLHSVSVLQVRDGASYAQTLGLLDLACPVEVVLSKQQVDHALFQKVLEQWGGDARPVCATISAIHRK